MADSKVQENPPWFFGNHVRGVLNRTLMLEDLLKIGRAIGVRCWQERKKRKEEGRPLVIIAKDPRRCNYAVQDQLIAALTSLGVKVEFTGPLPLPGLAMLARNLNVDYGIMITGADESHEVTGIQLFNREGWPTSRDEWGRLMALAGTDHTGSLPGPEGVGKAENIDNKAERYVQFLRDLMPQNINLQGIRVVIDCANGASYKLAPPLIAEMHAEVVQLNAAPPTGDDINDRCGPQHPEKLIERVKMLKADVGISISADGTTACLIDNLGAVIEDESIMELLNEHGVKKLPDQPAGIGIIPSDEPPTPSIIGVMLDDGHDTKYAFHGAPHHFVFPNAETVPDGLLLALRVLAILAEERAKPGSSTKQSIAQLTAKRQKPKAVLRKEETGAPT